MGERVFFRAGDIVVSSTMITVGRHTYFVKDWSAVRSERAHGRLALLHWLRGPYRVLLATAGGEETEIAHHRNAYFVFQLVNAIQSAMHQAKGPAVPITASAARIVA